MAEESGKGIALVILGIVAIIAIVGLVLLFTGARKGAAGEFAIPGVKEYGGAIRGIETPYDRAFAGRSYEYPSGMDEFARSQGEMSTQAGGVKVASERVTGETPYVKGVHAQIQSVSNRQREVITSVRNCEWLSMTTTGTNEFGTAADVTEFTAYNGRQNCIVLSDMKAHDWDVLANQLGLDRDAISDIEGATTTMIADGAYACCRNPSLNPTGQSYRVI